MNFDLKKELKNVKKDFKNGNIKKQIANILTASRLLAPFILIPLMYFDELKLFVIMIIFFTLTDAFDGYFARKYKAVSKLGAYLDAVVDKVFALSLLIPIIIKTTLNTNNFYLVGVNILLEIFIGLLNIYAFIKKFDPKSTMYGKIKTYFLFILLCILYLGKIITISDTFLFIFILITILLQIITIISYIDQISKRKNLVISS